MSFGALAYDPLTGIAITPGAPLSAMERARDQGFNIDAYHATHAPQFDKFKRRGGDIGIHFGTAQQASGSPEYKEWSRALDSYANYRKESAEDSYIVFEPSQVRSRFAQFDPKNRGKSGLLLEDAAAAGAPISALQKKKLPGPVRGGRFGQMAYEQSEE